MEKSKESQPALVFEETKQVGEVRSRWAWAEPSVWTDRMLDTLEEGIKGGKWYSLCDKAFSLKTLSACFTKVKANDGARGVDGVTIARFEKDLEQNLFRLHRALMEGTYQPQAVRRAWIPKPGSTERRPIGIPTVRDRIVQASIKAALEPIFEKEFRDLSFGFRPGRSCHQALSRVLRGLREGKNYVVDADVRKFFDTLPHELIMAGLEAKVSDGKMLGLIERYLKHGIVDEQTVETAEEGTPQGSVLSPLLANIALHGLDVLAEQSGFDLIRYADDFVVLCDTQEQAELALDKVTNWLKGQGLSLHPDKTRIVDRLDGQSFDFLGFSFKKRYFYPRKKSVQKLRDNVRSKTPRRSGRSLKAIIQDLNPLLRGWFNYFRASSESQFEAQDSFVRRRLRAMLDVRNHKHPAHRGATALRWPDAYFEHAGLYSMAASKRARSNPLV